MPESDPIDGDVYVSPRYLAGSTFTLDPAFEPLLALGWVQHHDDLGNFYITAPDHKIRFGFLPEGEDDGMWRISAYTDSFAQPHWGVCFSEETPTELITAFTTALATAYQAGPTAYLSGPDQDAETGELGISASSAFVPMMKHDWEFQTSRWSVLELQPSDGLAGLQYATGHLNHHKELTTLEARWYLWGGPENRRHWYATASSNTPVPLVKAITTVVSDPAPLLRWKAEMSSVRLASLGDRVQMAPVTPPAPPVPTPLDVHRTIRHQPALRTHSVPRWSTTSAPPSAGSVSRPGPRR